MILFADDWSKYPTAIADVKTPNRSFVRLAAVYKSMGIRNHMFLLALVHPELQGVDPFDPTLTRAVKDMIVVECKINPWYYFREVARVPGGSGEEAIPMEGNRGNLALWWSFFNHIMILLIQPRQTGKSLSTDELMVYLLNVLCASTVINLMTKDEKLRKENIQRMKNIISELPPFLNQRNLKVDINNTEELSIVALKNKYLTHLPQGSEKAAWNVGRGFTSPIIQMDEPPYCPNIDISMPVMLSSSGAARERAARSGSPYGVILTTTAGKQDEREGEFIYGILQESMVWSEKILFDVKDWEELDRVVRKNSRSGPDGRGYFQVNATFSHRQLGKTDEWLFDRIAVAKITGDAAERDFMNVWTSGTVSHPLSPQMLKAIKESKKSDPYHEIDPQDGYIIRWYMPEHELESYMANNTVVVGIDTSDAVGRDDIALVFTDTQTLKVVGAATVNETLMITFGDWLCRLLVKYQNVTAIIERRSTGASIQDQLLKLLPLHGEDPFKRMFNLTVQEMEEKPDRFNEIRQGLNRRDPFIYTKNKATFGFATAGSGVASRSKLYSTILINAAKRSSDRINDDTLIGQILGLTTRNNRIDHAVGKHDDAVVAWLLTHWFLSEGINLAWYGIDRVMTDIATDKKLTPEEYKFRLRQNATQDKMQVMLKELGECSDEYVSRMLEHQLRVLGKSIIYEAGQVNSVDQLINNIKDEKKKKRTVNANRNVDISQDDYYRSMMRLGSQYSR